MNEQERKWAEARMSPCLRCRKSYICKDIENCYRLARAKVSPEVIEDQGYVNNPKAMLEACDFLIEVTDCMECLKNTGHPRFKEHFMNEKMLKVDYKDCAEYYSRLANNMSKFFSKKQLQILCKMAESEMELDARYVPEFVESLIGFMKNTKDTVEKG